MPERKIKPRENRDHHKMQKPWSITSHSNVALRSRNPNWEGMAHWPKGGKKWGEKDTTGQAAKSRNRKNGASKIHFRLKPIELLKGGKKRGE